MSVNLCHVSRVDQGARLLPGEIAGVDAFFHRVRRDGALHAPKRRGFVSIIFVISGKGTIRTEEHSHQVDGMGILYCDAENGLTVTALSPSIELLEIDYLAHLPSEAQGRERFLPYAQCPTYREAIKSPKTVNRTLVPETVIPRFTMGSVETEGPDEVGAHAHPMLEQLFFGLPGNDCLIRADDATVPFGACVLLHIPLGARHGAAVAAGKKLHYLWLDFFLGDDMSWIAKHHLPGRPESESTGTFSGC